MANLWVDTAQLIDNSVSSIKIQSGSITFAKIQNPLTCDWVLTVGGSAYRQSGIYMNDNFNTTQRDNYTF